MLFTPGLHLIEQSDEEFMKIRTLGMYAFFFLSSSFSPRSIKDSNALPLGIKQTGKQKDFKQAL